MLPPTDQCNVAVPSARCVPTGLAAMSARARKWPICSCSSPLQGSAADRRPVARTRGTSLLSRGICRALAPGGQSDAERPSSEPPTLPLCLPTPSSDPTRCCPEHHAQQWLRGAAPPSWRCERRVRCTPACAIPGSPRNGVPAATAGRHATAGARGAFRWQPEPPEPPPRAPRAARRASATPAPALPWRPGPRGGASRAPASSRRAAAPAAGSAPRSPDPRTRGAFGGPPPRLWRH
mmetsp:Transcript_131481/g.420675  ORF Transcript_131481/g.420675 Transcript_131481/m.420675 type:complete len:236 (+) Transcript_131481:2439-3146(+)